MEGPKNKRKLAATGESQKQSKKPKIRVQPKKSSQKARRTVALDSLRWRTSQLPDMLNDAEGFYGLEEVDDVEVYKNEDNIIQFRAFDTQSEAASDAAGDESDEFEGFDDEPVAPASKETGASKPSAPEPKTADESVANKKETKAEKKAKKASQAVKDPELESNVFAALEDVDAPQDDFDASAWVPLELSPALISSIAKLKFSKPTTIQAASIPHVLAGHDVIGKASTGSGKTLAFAIPIVERWLENQEDGATENNGPLALILSPTRELAHQLTDHIKALCQGLPNSPFVCSVTGGLSVLKQQRQLSKANIVVGTPGRLWEVLSSSSELMGKFKSIGFLVVDEADRLLSEGHFKEAEQLFDALDRYEADEEDVEEREPTPRQTLVFSATFHKGLQQKLAGKGKYGLMNKDDSMEYLLRKLNFREERPKFVDVNPISQMAEGLKEGLVECGAMEKDLYLYTVLLLYPTARTLIFTNSISAARRITPMLQNLNLSSLPLHSQMAQKARLRSIERFSEAPKGKGSILVATDVAARGLDIPNVDLVIHYHVPRAADAYVHRSGRTARAERTGVSILLCAPEEVVPTRRLIAKVHSDKGMGKNHFVQTVDMDRKLAGRLKQRVTLAKKIADSTLAKEKGSKEDDWMRNAAEELGVDYDSEELEKAGKWGGRGGGRKKKQDEARSLTKAELGAMKGELKALLAQRVNTGVSEKYITSGLVDIDELLKGAKGDFLGKVDGLDISSL
ncbi:ATP-dependent RNA helicase MAK5 [Pestalotiopsis fici W106-1]|uniref:ATP-dependent RNA helicase n=1 Tax=Pestalotiopsis fici (strain W106-1 / CGMCC3.15140) TaxID=1229662 RepID=W3WYZ8_PESFW|nr:ATP-dependent RNA helicase MAK5 [Pestalotiopsis fici W106-1]ETS78332.1 ATP-dependent RNA helicase MAK5 [Pestalotiopsis fici W106-1]